MSKCISGINPDDVLIVDGRERTACDVVEDEARSLCDGLARRNKDALALLAAYEERFGPTDNALDIALLIVCMRIDEGEILVKVSGSIN